MKHSAWDVFKQYCPHHPALDDFTDFKALMSKIRAGESTQIARYNDGEWIWMLQIQPHYMRYMVNYGGNKAEVDKISEKLLGIIDSCPDYWIGVGSTTRAGQGITETRKKEIDLKLSRLNKLTYGDIFNAATIKMGINPLIEPLRERKVITVGPDYMKKLGISDDHVSVPVKNCWEQADKIQKLLQEKTTGHPVVLYSCSLLAKYLIDVNYRLLGDEITQLDLGSCIDPWCGITSRPWHRYLLI